MPSKLRRLLLYLITACILCMILSAGWRLANEKAHVEPQHLSINLVIAAKTWEDYSWTSRLNIPNIQVIPYIVNDPKARFQPRKHKGREAMVILTYLYDFYDNLPDISIFAHAEDKSWHNEAVLNRSTGYALQQLDLEEVTRRRYMSLRVSWDNGCPDWINMSIKPRSSAYSAQKQEEPYMLKAFSDNFPTTSIPPVIAAPCCSQFAVTRSAIRSISRLQYLHHINWLLSTELKDDFTGRIWEHFWHFLFLGKAVDCPIEWKAMCAAYHVCFENQVAYEDFDRVAKIKERQEATRRDMLDAVMTDWAAVAELNKSIYTLEFEMGKRRHVALKRGTDRITRQAVIKDLWE